MRGDSKARSLDAPARPLARSLEVRKWALGAPAVRLADDALELGARPQGDEDASLPDGPGTGLLQLDLRTRRLGHGTPDSVEAHAPGRRASASGDHRADLRQLEGHQRGDGWGHGYFPGSGA